jgi:type VI secretion system secreted protein Hcp
MAYEAYDCFLKIDGIEGESHDAKHKGDIDIHSWSFSEHQKGSNAAGGGGGVGKVGMDDFQFTMHTNKASPRLFLACANGDHIKKATLVCRKAGKQQQEYLTITFSDVLVSRFQMSVNDSNFEPYLPVPYLQTNGSSHSKSEATPQIQPVDRVSLAFAKIEVEYKEQKADGTLGGPVMAGYNLKTNTKV